MYSLIGFSNAVVAEAFVFRTGRNRMRAVVAGLGDALELCRIGNYWYSEYGESVSLEFVCCGGVSREAEELEAIELPRAACQ